MAPTVDDLTPKFGRTGNLDAKTFILGQGNVMVKERIQEFFNCVGNLSLDDAPILKTTRSYADAISTLVLKLEINLSALILLCKDCFLSFRR